MQKILFIIQNISDRAGSQRVAVELANSLSNFYTIDLIYVGNESIAYNIKRNINLLPQACKRWQFPWRVKKQLKKQDYEFVLVHTMNKLTLSLLLIGVRHSNLFSLEHISHSSNSNIISLLKKRYYPSLSGIITLTERERKHYLTVNKNVITLPNPSPYSLSAIKKGAKKTVIAIGTLDKRKAFDRLLKVWKIVEKKSQDYCLEIYGEGPERKKLQKMIEDLHLTRVALKGATADPEPVYQKASIFVMTSLFEGLPMVLIEAQTFGLPIVAFDCPSGPREVINDSFDGYLIEDGNIERFADKLLLLMHDQELLKKFAHNALSSAARFEKKEIISQWVRLIKGHSQTSRN